MPTEANMHTTGTLGADIVAVWLEDELLSLSEETLVFYPLCQKSTIPTGNGRVIEFKRYERVKIPTRPLEEGVTPALSPMTISTVQAVVDQWGALIGITDQAEMTVKHPTMKIARDRLSECHDRLVDREIQVVLMGSSSVYYAGNAASRTALTAANVLRTDDLRRLNAQMSSRGARRFDSKGWRLVVNPFVKADLTKDPTFVAAGTYSQVSTLKDYDVGKWMGCWVQESNFMPVLTFMDVTYVTQAVATGGAIPAGGVGFTAVSPAAVRSKVVFIDPETGFPAMVDAEVASSDPAAFSLGLTIIANAPSGEYIVYVSLEGGASGTATRQVKVTHTQGTPQTVNFVKAGTGLPAGTFVVTGTGEVAPPDVPNGVPINISYLLGKEAVGCTSLGGGMQATFVPRTPSAADPLAQRSYAGFKRMFKACVLNPDYLFRIESASDYN